MQRQKLLVTVPLLAVLLLGLLGGLATAQAPTGADAGPAAVALGPGFTYQGQLLQGGVPVNGSCDLRFTLYDAASGGNQVGSPALRTVTVTGGLFTVPDLNFGSTAFTGQARWLKVEASCPSGPTPTYTAVGALQELTATPYALYAAGNWGLAGNAGTTAGTNFLGTTDNQVLDLRVWNARGLRIEPVGANTPNLIGGYLDNIVTSGVFGATIDGGGYRFNLNRVTDNFGAVGGGALNRAGDDAGETSDKPYATVGGGYSNSASGISATIGGGSTNLAGGSHATVGGGDTNTASGTSATVAGGIGNSATSVLATIGGGDTNTASANSATVAGGYHNTASGSSATVAGGTSNTAGGSYATVPGGHLNSAAGYTSFAAGRRAKANHDGSFVWGDATDADIASSAANQFLARASNGVNFVVGAGGWRIKPGDYSPNVVGGSSANNASVSVSAATIAGGGSWNADCGANPPRHCDNFVSADYATIGGGGGNIAYGEAATVAGGSGNTTGSLYGINEWSPTIGGGTGNTASAAHATIGGGYGNTASGSEATIGGGRSNTASGSNATIGGGFYNTASGSEATVPGGFQNTAGGAYSFAAGQKAIAAGAGSFVWADYSTGNVFSAPGDNQFWARASGGYRFFTNWEATIGSSLEPGSGAWTVSSDRNMKENFAAVDPQALLDALAKVPVSTWNYKTQDAAIRHIGPMAQDFYAAFAVGEDNLHISTVDSDGVALAASQGLYRLAQEQAGQIATLKLENAALKAEVADQRQVNSEQDARLAAIEAKTGATAAPFAGRWGFLGLAAAGLAVGVVLSHRGGPR